MQMQLTKLVSKDWYDSYGKRSIRSHFCIFKDPKGHEYTVGVGTHTFVKELQGIVECHTPSYRKVEVATYRVPKVGETFNIIKTMKYGMEALEIDFASQVGYCQDCQGLGKVGYVDGVEIKWSGCASCDGVCYKV